MNKRSQLLLGCALVVLTLTTGCRKEAVSKDNAPPPVIVQTPKQEPVTDYLEFTGTVAASLLVDLVARVVGYLDSVHFKDGSYVEKDQLLFVIEPKPYEEQLALSKAQLDQANSEYERQQGLIKQNATSVANVEKWKSQRDQAAAQVQLAQINLDYTKVTAPFTGRIGRRLVDPGNLVGGGGATKLATLEQLVPIYVYFNLNESEALRMRTLLKEAGIEPLSQVNLAKVQISLQDEKGFPHEGVLDFVDSNVSTSTGTVQMRATLKNEDKALFPGLFAQVRIPLGDPSPMLVIPESAIGNDQQGDYVLVVGTDDTVERKNIEKGNSTPEGRAIRSGIAASDHVIVEGMQKAKVGEKVTVTKPTAKVSEP